MIKNFFIVLFLTSLILSCGKKGDPIYDENQEKQNSKIINVQDNTFA